MDEAVINEYLDEVYTLDKAGYAIQEKGELIIKLRRTSLKYYRPAY